MAMCKNGDVTLYYEVHGDGEPLVFVSGLGGGAWSWFMQLPFFQQRYLVIVFDNRGAGRSSTPAGPYSMEDLALDVIAIMDNLRIDQAMVVGVSMGGMIAQQLCVIAPERVKGMVLGCTHCGKSQRIPPPGEVMEVLTNNEGLSPEEIIDKNIPILFNKSFVEANPQIIEQYKRNALSVPPQSPEGFASQIAAIQGFDVCEKLPTISTPVLIITGKKDILVPPENSRILHRLIPNSELVEFDDVGHAVHVEAADMFNKKVDEFFEMRCRT